MMCHPSFQLCEHFQSPGEYALFVDTHVALWLDSRAHKKLPCLPEVSGSVIVTETLQEEFDKFKSALPHMECSHLEIGPLLQYWNTFVRPSPGIPITMFGKQYLELHYSEVDCLCQWVVDTRACGRRDITISDSGPSLSNHPPLPVKPEKPDKLEKPVKLEIPLKRQKVLNS